MTRLGRVTALLVLLCATHAHADREVGQTAIPTSNGGVPFSCSSYNFNNSAFLITQSGSTCLIGPSGNVTLAGTCIDQSADFCADGVGPTWLAPPTNYRSGGTGADGDFTYASQNGGACTGDICRGGTCPGGGICQLTLNSALLQWLGTKSVAVENYNNFTLTSGTVQGAAPASTGGGLILRIAGNATITGGTITVQGMGPTGGASGTATCSAVGKAGGANGWGLFPAGGAAGAATPCTTTTCDGGAGVAALGFNTWAPFENPFVLGAGGSSQTTVGTAAGVASGFTTQQPVTGSSGGGSGGCTAACTTTTAGAGGQGGGFLHMEVGSTYSCSGATVTAAGTNGGNGTGPGGGGGGGGSIHVLARAITTDTCTYSAAGGTGGTGQANKCGAGGVGGAGSAVRELLGR